MRSKMLGLLIVSLAASTASAGTIGIFFDTGAATCSGHIAKQTIGRFYIIALVSDIDDVMTGAEFRVDGLPTGWVANVMPNPESIVVLGNLFDGVGCNIAFAQCQTANAILLFTVDVAATTEVSDQYLRVLSRNPPPQLPCPWVAFCSPPYLVTCVSGGEAIINPTSAGCTVAVGAASWSRVKRLYE